MISRDYHQTQVLRLLRQFPVVGMLGPRQVGKTTLALQVAAQYGAPVTRFDLEDPRSLSRLADPMLALEPLKGLVILDEVQRRPEIFPILRVLADRPRKPARFLVLGSAAPDLLSQSSESLAGRIAYHELTGFGIDEVGAKNLERLWLRGGFPLSYSPRTDGESQTWRQQFIRTFVERDLMNLGFKLTSSTVHRFWTMLAHYHAQTWNGAELGRAFGVTEKTVKHYLDVLAETFMVRRLSPWHANVSKREVKAPKVYIRDSGLLHSLLDIGTLNDLRSHPKVGASWEGLIVELVIRKLKANANQCFFWGVHAGPELDLLVKIGAQCHAFEIKHTDSPVPTRSMHTAIETLKLDSLTVVHAGVDSYDLTSSIRAISAFDLFREVGGKAKV